MGGFEVIRCPRCKVKGEDVWLEEVWDGNVVQFEQRTDGSISAEGTLLQTSDPVKVRGICKCGHRWTLRGVAQIADLRKMANCNDGGT